MHAKMFMVMLALSWIAPTGCGGEDEDLKIVDRSYTTGGMTNDGEGEGTIGDTEDEDEPEICEAYATWLVGCDPEADPGQVVTACREGRSEVAPACLELLDAGLACLVDVECTDDTTCTEELEAYSACLYPIGEVCTAFGATFAGCGLGDAGEQAGACQAEIDSYSAEDPECSAAMEGYFACLSQGTCLNNGLYTDCEAETENLDVCWF